MAFYYGGKYADQLKEIDSLDNYGKVSYLNLALESKGWQWWNLKKTNFIDLFEKYIIRKLKSTHLTLKEKNR